ncbi:LOB domain-containing protein 1 [Momordica charantia]|uniref:LOB domain-containing protein 1 n=1 Tax=Momordica charantia TaxID=3673 RepID=A0A6J1CFI2_MOMCH|nr:LOB domain-containing protein 1 [Momordica charantia]
MEGSDTITAVSSTPLSQSPSPSPSSSSPPSVILSPCAACKILRRRCADRCVLAPYFPPTDPAKFAIAHRVYGASNIIKFLQELPESQRADAVSSLVYEASARIRDPVYGSAGAICQLQKQVNELQAQLAKAQAELVNMQCQQANLVALVCREFAQSHQSVDDFNSNSPHSGFQSINQSYFEDTNVNPLWEPLWTS